MTERKKEMTVKEFLEKLAEQPLASIHLAMDGAELWSNEACMGYTISACMAAGISEGQEEALMEALKTALDNMTLDEAEEIYRTCGN